MQSANSASDVYPAGLLLAFREPMLLANGQGESLIRLAKVPWDHCQHVAKVPATKFRHRSSAARRADAKATTAVTEVLPMVGDDVQHFVQDALGAGSSSGRLRQIERSTGAQVSERQGVKGRKYLMISGSFQAVEKALPQLQDLLAAAEQAIAERKVGAALASDTIASVQKTSNELYPPGLPPPRSDQRASDEVVTPALLDVYRLWHPGEKEFIRDGSDTQLELEEEAASLIQSWCSKLFWQAKCEPVGKLTPSDSGCDRQHCSQAGALRSLPLSDMGKPASIIQASAVETNLQMRGQARSPLPPTVRPPPPPVPLQAMAACSLKQRADAEEETMTARLPATLGEWTCVRCTLFNSREQTWCKACGGFNSPQDTVPKALTAKSVRPRPIVVKATKSEKQEEPLHPLPQRNAAPSKAPRMLVARLVVGSSCSNAASGRRWAERPVQKVNRGTCAEEDQDPALACYLWNRRSHRSIAESCPAARAWGVAR